MNILVVGSGGREAALAHKIAHTPKAKIFCAPGNAGIASLAKCAPIAADQIESLLLWAKENRIDLTVVGPEIPLSLGIVDRFCEAGLKIFGPTAKAAQIETSKGFSKQFMQKYGIPTAAAEVMPIKEAYNHIEMVEMPVVLKRDGLASGKGVCIAQNAGDARAALDEFAAKGETIVLLERYLTGVEATFLVIADGDYGALFATAQDYKRLLDDDRGPNTGGMGAISPSPIILPAMAETIMAAIVRPALQGMVKEGMPYTGMLYVGLIMTATGPYVLEFNARLGDPETQAVLPRLKTDFADVIDAALTHRLDRLHLAWREEAAVSVVLASAGYPGDKIQNGEVISGLDDGDGEAILFHAGTIKRQNQILTHGGRVLAVTALGHNQEEARQKAYRAVSRIFFRGMQYRTDIGR